MTSFLYDWSRRFTNDPAFPSAPLPAEVYLDGKLVPEPIMRCCTGERGYVVRLPNAEPLRGFVTVEFPEPVKHEGTLS